MPATWRLRHGVAEPVRRSRRTDLEVRSATEAVPRPLRSTALVRLLRASTDVLAFFKWIDLHPPAAGSPSAYPAVYQPATSAPRWVVPAWLYKLTRPPVPSFTTTMLGTTWPAV